MSPGPRRPTSACFGLAFGVPRPLGLPEGAPIEPILPPVEDERRFVTVFGFDGYAVEALGDVKATEHGRI